MGVLFISLLMVGLSIAVHYEVLRLASLKATHFPIVPRLRITVILVAALASHMVHIVLYAAAYYAMEHWTSMGSIDGPSGHNFGDAVYFSITSYTTLGIGDLYPTGDVRLLSGIEALNGLVMVGWTASMTYIYMEKFWHIRPR